MRRSEGRRREPATGGVAQVGEHLPCKQGVSGSNPLVSMEQQEARRRQKRRSLTWRSMSVRVRGDGHARRKRENGVKAEKGIRWMPWRVAAKKDVVNCEKPWGVVHRPRARDVRMGEPACRHGQAFSAEASRR